MIVENAFYLDIDPDTAYAALLDLDEVIPCLPGAVLLGTEPDGTRRVRVSITFGPMRFAYEGDVRIVQADAASRVATLHASAIELGEEGSAEAEIRMAVAEQNAKSRISTHADVEITGWAAELGGAMMQDVAEQMIGDMSRNLEARLAAKPTAPEPVPALSAGLAPSVASIRGGRLVLRIVVARIRRQVG